MARTTEEEDIIVFLFLLMLGVTEENKSFERPTGRMLCAAVDASTVGSAIICFVVGFKRNFFPLTVKS